jgi:hypothetical protein
MKETANENPLHFDALTLPFSIGRRKIFQLSSAPWQGDNTPLKIKLDIRQAELGRHLCFA